jgi:hypothetical protein
MRCFTDVTSPFFVHWNKPSVTTERFVLAETILLCHTPELLPCHQRDTSVSVHVSLLSADDAFSEELSSQS